MVDNQLAKTKKKKDLLKIKTTQQKPYYNSINNNDNDNDNDNANGNDNDNDNVIVNVKAANTAVATTIKVSMYNETILIENKDSP